MNYSRVSIASFGYELPPNVVTSDDLERRLEPLYEALRIQKGQLEAITGIRERRYWDPDFALHAGAARAGRKALEASGIPRERIGMLIYGAVCRENLEPATACAVADALGLRPECQIYDVSNACLGVLNGMVRGRQRASSSARCGPGWWSPANRRAKSTGLMIERLLREKSMDVFAQVHRHLDRRLRGGRRSPHRWLLHARRASQAARRG